MQYGWNERDGFKQSTLLSFQATGVKHWRTDTQSLPPPLQSHMDCFGLEQIYGPTSTFNQPTSITTKGNSADISVIGT